MFCFENASVARVELTQRRRSTDAADATMLPESRKTATGMRATLAGAGGAGEITNISSISGSAASAASLDESGTAHGAATGAAAAAARGVAAAGGGGAAELLQQYCGPEIAPLHRSARESSGASSVQDASSFLIVNYGAGTTTAVATPKAVRFNVLEPRSESESAAAADVGEPAISFCTGAIKIVESPSAARARSHSITALSSFTTTEDAVGALRRLHDAGESQQVVDLGLALLARSPGIDSAAVAGATESGGGGGGGAGQLEALLEVLHLVGRAMTAVTWLEEARQAFQLLQKGVNTFPFASQLERHQWMARLHLDVAQLHEANGEREEACAAYTLAWREQALMHGSESVAAMTTFVSIAEVKTHLSQDRAAWLMLGHATAVLQRHILAAAAREAAGVEDPIANLRAHAAWLSAARLQAGILGRQRRLGDAQRVLRGAIELIRVQRERLSQSSSGAASGRGSDAWTFPRSSQQQQEEEREEEGVGAMSAAWARSRRHCDIELGLVHLAYADTTIDEEVDREQSCSLDALLLPEEEEQPCDHHHDSSRVPTRHRGDRGARVCSLSHSVQLRPRTSAAAGASALLLMERSSLMRVTRCVGKEGRRAASVQGFLMRAVATIEIAEASLAAAEACLAQHLEPCHQARVRVAMKLEALKLRKGYLADCLRGALSTPTTTTTNGSGGSGRGRSDGGALNDDRPLQQTAMDNLAAHFRYSTHDAVAHISSLLDCVQQATVRGEQRRVIMTELSEFLGDLYAARRDPAHAAKAYNEALACAKTHFAPDHEVCAHLQLKLADAFASMGRLDDAYHLTLELLSWCDACPTNRRPPIPRVVLVHTLGIVCHQREQLTLAAKFYSEALREDACDFDTQCRVMASLASLALLQGDAMRAVELSKRVLKIRQQLHGDVHAEVAVALSSLATLYEARGEWELAALRAKECMRMLEVIATKNAGPEAGAVLTRHELFLRMGSVAAAAKQREHLGRRR